MKVSQAVLLLASKTTAVQQVVDKTRQLDIELSVDDSSRSGDFFLFYFRIVVFELNRYDSYRMSVKLETSRTERLFSWKI